MRDFPHAPLMLVTQPLNAMNAEYESMNADVVQRLTMSPTSHQVIYINAYTNWKEHGFSPARSFDTMHLSNEGHASVVSPHPE